MSNDPDNRKANHCPECPNKDALYNQEGDYWWCQNCGEGWVSDNDTDWDEYEFEEDFGEKNS